jgi:prolyl oligopeptidase
MNTRSVPLFFAVVVLAASCHTSDQPAEAPVQMVTDTYYGVQVDDPYRYMETMDDTVFLDWMKAYADYTRGVLDGIPGRQSLISLMKDFDERQADQITSLRITEGERYFYTKMIPQDETPKLYYRDGYEGQEKLLYDPEVYRPEAGLSYVISGVHPSIEGDKIGIALSPNGSESNTLIVLDVETGELYKDQVEQVMGYVSWMPQGKGFIYMKSNSDDIHDPQRLLNTRVYYHALGTHQGADWVVFSSERAPEVNMRPEELPFVMYDHHNDEMILMLYTVERYVKLYIAEGSPLTKKKVAWKQLIRAEDQIQGYYIMDDALYLYTARNASNFKLLKTLKHAPDVAHAQVVISEPDDAMISGFAFTDEAIYYKLKYNGIEEKLFRLPYGEERSVQIQLPASAGWLGIGTRGHRFSDIWVTITGWTMDGRRYRYQLAEDRFVPEPLSSEPEYPEYKDLVVEQLMVESHDETLVPLSVIYREGTLLDGTAPLLLTGYGAYGIPQTPRFNPFKLIWTLKGGVIAVAHVRGGGELGDAWRLGGHKSTKPNSWKDFIACAEYLIDHSYSSSEHMAASAGSSGGILIGRSMTERPDLFAAVSPQAGVMNTVRLEESPNGPVNAPEFGTVSDSLECMALIEMDSYLHIEDGVDYPATLITAGFNDPRVIVWQSAKFAARLQAANSSRHPILFEVDYTSGHGMGDTKSKAFEDLADLFAFSLWQTGHPEFQEK